MRHAGVAQVGVDGEGRLLARRHHRGGHQDDERDRRVLRGHHRRDPAALALGVDADAVGVDAGVGLQEVDRRLVVRGHQHVVAVPGRVRVEPLVGHHRDDPRGRERVRLARGRPCRSARCRHRARTRPPASGPSSPTGSLICASTVAPSRRTETTDVRTSYRGTGAADPIAVDDVSTTSGSASGTGSHCGPMTAPRTARISDPESRARSDPVGPAHVPVHVGAHPRHPSTPRPEHGQKPSFPSCFGSRCQSLATLTCRSR